MSAVAAIAVVSPMNGMTEQKRTPKERKRRRTWGTLRTGGATGPTKSAVVGLQRLESATRLYIGRGRLSSEWTEAERLAIELVSHVGLNFLHGSPDELAGALRKALKLFPVGPATDAPVSKRRAWCVRAIHEHGARWNLAETEAQKGFVVHSLARELASYDDRFEVLRQDQQASAELRECLRLYTPQRANGRKTADRILAELCWDHGALGFEPREGEADEDSVERMRKRIGNDVDAYLE